MAFFITRVELHGAGESDYQKLHAAMATKGFSRSIRADNGVNFKLPPAEYCSSHNATVQQVALAAKKAADETRRTSEVLVGAVTSWSSFGLPVA